MRPDPEKKESYIKMHPEFCQISKAEPTLIIFNDNEFSASNFFLLGYPIIAFIILGTKVDARNGDNNKKAHWSETRARRGTSFFWLIETHTSNKAP
uniref:Uncharacterized protein n=1 Tax=Panagrolaimus sp. JU765 TaxID=591449 RepID=A0AC34Q8G8_9BILA